MYTFYEEIELGCQSLDGDFQPQFYSSESGQTQHEDYSLRSHVASWMNLAEYAALAGHMLYPEQQEDQGEGTEDMYAPALTSLDQAHCTTEQPEELRRQAKAPS
jgi:hypothetical protein